MWGWHPRSTPTGPTQVHANSRGLLATRVEISFYSDRAASAHDPRCLSTAPHLVVRLAEGADQFAPDARWRLDRECEWGIVGSRPRESGAAFSECLFDAGDDVALGVDRCSVSSCSTVPG
jgi:hypothetical protein